MGVFNNFTHLLLSFVFAVIVIPTSWSAAVNHGNSASSQYYRQPKQIDERISNLIAENVLNFAHNLGVELAALDPHSEKSEIFSPLSLMTTLSFLMLGAKGNSYQQLKQLLGLNSDSELKQNPSKYHEELGMMLNELENSNAYNSGDYKRPIAKWRLTTSRNPSSRIEHQSKVIIPHTIRLANGLFLQSNTLNPDYRQVIESIYKSVVIPLDFQNHNREARDYINEWVNKATFGKITQLISDDIDKTTNIIIASTLYFRAFWETSFFKGVTRDDDFYPDGTNNPPIKIKMMANMGIFPYYYAKEYDCSIIGLPYDGNETTMYVIQPNHSTRQRLRELQHVLNARKINEMIDKMERKTVSLAFPKMHFKRSLDMKNILSKMNVNDIFVNGLSDLSLIGGGPPSRYASLPVPDPISTPSPLPTLSPLPVQSSFPVQFPLAISEYLNKRPVLFSDIYRKPPAQQIQIPDRFNEPSSLIVSRVEAIPKFFNNRTKRDVADLNKDTVKNALLNLETDRSKIDSHPTNHIVDEIIHKVDFSVDEQGTEAAAATATILRKTGGDILFRVDAPFLILIRHDPTKLTIFYGIINKPEL
ncbi:hypothetical protein DOY81_011936 [Sarcophaga bullata]|nr:hypothetical protein DOY81_011936 [Sarcophaga bullata]